MANNFEITLNPSAWLPAATNGPAQGCLPTYDRSNLAYDDTTKETALSRAIRIPASYTGLGTLKGDVDYVMATATSGNVAFELSVEAVTPGDAIDLDAADSFDSANSSSGAVPATAGHPQRITVTLSNKDSVAAGDYMRLKLARIAPTNGATATATGDARVLSVVLREEV